MQKACLPRGVARHVQIRPTYVADQQRVPCEGEPGIPRAAPEVGDQIGVMHRGVPGSRERTDDRVAHLHLLAIRERVMIEIDAGIDRKVGTGPGPLHEHGKAGHVIGLDVRLEHGGNRRSDHGRSVDVFIHEISVGIHDRELGVRQAAEQIAGARALVIEERAQDHRFSSCVRLTRRPAARHAAIRGSRHPADAPRVPVHAAASRRHRRTRSMAPGSRRPPRPRRAGRISRRVEVVAYCRGRYCVYADDAVRLLRAQGGVGWGRLDVGSPNGGCRATGRRVSLTHEENR